MTKKKEVETKEINVFADQSKLPVPVEVLEQPEAQELVYLDSSALGAYLSHIKEQLGNEVTSVETDEGRKRIKELGRLINQSGQAIENPGRAYMKRLKASVKPAERNIKTFTDGYKELRQTVLKPLADWQAEQDRIADEIEAKVIRFPAIIERCRETLGGMDIDYRVTHLADLISEVKEIEIDDSYGKRKEEAEENKKLCLDELARYHEHAELKQNQAKVEAEKAAIEQAKREKQLQEEVAAKAIEEEKARNEQEKINAKAREDKLKEDAVLAEHRAQQAAQKQIDDANARAAQDIENEKIRIQKEANDKAQAEADRQAEALKIQKAKSEDKAHKTEVNKEILGKVMGLGFTKDDGIKIITAAVRGELGSMVVKY